MKTPDKSMRLFRISEASDIRTFIPRPSPSAFEQIKGDVVFAVSEQFLHNYLFPRDCPRVCYCLAGSSSAEDKHEFFTDTSASYVLAIEEGWLERLRDCTLYAYEFEPGSFHLLDECAGYYVSSEKVRPLAVREVNPYQELLQREDVSLKVLPEIRTLAARVAASSLRFSLIRMRNAK